MNRQQLQEALASLTPTQSQKDRMLAGILEKSRRAPRRTWLGPAAAAAACCAALTLCWPIFKQPENASTPAPGTDLPVLEIALESGGMGFEGMMACSIDELLGGNPWLSDPTLTSLPVYRNGRYQAQGSGWAEILTPAQQRERAEELASLLGVEITGTAPYADYLFLCTDGIEIAVYSNGEERVTFEPHLPVEDLGETAESHLAALKDCYEKFSHLFDFEKPAFDVGGDYTFSGMKGFWHRVYEGDGSLRERFLSYSLEGVSFGLLTEEQMEEYQGDKLLNIWREAPVREDWLVGEYPLMTAERAQELLLEGRYLTTVPEDFAGPITEGTIGAVELVYRSSGYDGYLMPMYRFYIPVTNFGSMAEGLINYGMYYVPAVEEQYFTWPESLQFN